MKKLQPQHSLWILLEDLYLLLTRIFLTKCLTVASHFALQFSVAALCLPVSRGKIHGLLPTLLGRQPSTRPTMLAFPRSAVFAMSCHVNRMARSTIYVARGEIQPVVTRRNARRHMQQLGRQPRHTVARGCKPSHRSALPFSSI